MLRVLSAAVAAVALLGISTLPASAATVSHAKPKVHNFSIPGTTGIRAWGSYYRSGVSVHVTVCVKEMSSKVNFAGATGVAFSKTGRHQVVDAAVVGSSKQACRSITTKDTAHLYVDSRSGTTDGHVHFSKVKQVY
jgi:hypothetical protein